MTNKRKETMKKVLTVVFAWYVVTYSGGRVAGPFTLLNDCADMAKFMAKRYYNVSEVCRSF
jgi:hypothetical protein